MKKADNVGDIAPLVCQLKFLILLNLVFMFQKEHDEQKSARPTAHSVCKVGVTQFDEMKKAQLIEQVKEIVENRDQVNKSCFFLISMN